MYTYIHICVEEVACWLVGADTLLGSSIYLSISMYIYIYIYMLYVYIYIYIHRERERDCSPAVLVFRLAPGADMLSVIVFLGRTFILRTPVS